MLEQYENPRTQFSLLVTGPILIISPSSDLVRDIFGMFADGERVQC
jgi:hypothetical protein